MKNIAAPFEKGAANSIGEFKRHPTWLPGFTSRKSEVTAREPS